MFCPKCGTNCPPNERFCQGCGFDLGVANTPDMPSDFSMPAQDAAPEVLPAAQVNTPVEPDMFSQQPSEPVKPKKKGSGKKIAIAAGATAAAAAVGVGGYFLVTNLITKETIKENPTKAVYASYDNYLTKRTCESGGLFSIVKNAAEQGTFAFKVDGNFNNTPVNAALTLSYDENAKEYYFKLDGNYLPMLVGGASGQALQDVNSVIELYTNIDKIVFNADVMGAGVNYYLDWANIRQDAEGSAFNPANGNQLMDKDSFEKFISSMEESYKAIKNSNTEKTETEDKLIELLEKYGKPVLTDETITVRGEQRNVTTITYTFDKEAMKSVITDAKNELIKILDDNKDIITNYDEAKEGAASAFEQMIVLLDSDSVKPDIKLVVKSSLDRNTNEAAKLEVTLDNYSTEDNAPVKLVGEFGSGSDLDIYFEFTIDHPEKGGKASASLTSKKEGSVTTYTLEAKEKGNTEESESSFRGFANYDDSAKTFKLGYSLNGGEEQSISGKADISDKKASFSYDLSEYVQEMGASSLTLSLDLMAEAQINRISSDNNILKMDAEQFNSILSGLSSLVPSSSGNYDYNYDYFDDNSPNEAKLMSDAATIDNLCKVYYAGILAGTINNETDDVSIDTLPSKSATIVERQEAANNATVYGALEYNGMDVYDFDLFEMGILEDGSIVYANDSSFSDQLTDDYLMSSTTLGELYNR